MSTRDAHLCVCGHTRRQHSESYGTNLDCRSRGCECAAFERATVAGAPLPTQLPRTRRPQGRGPERSDAA